MTNIQKIQNSSNMVAISQTILTSVWAEFSVKFASIHRPFVRAKESQESWVAAVNMTYGNDIKTERKKLFSLVPERFFITRLYKELYEEIN